MPDKVRGSTVILPSSSVKRPFDPTVVLEIESSVVDKINSAITITSQYKFIAILAGQTIYFGGARFPVDFDFHGLKAFEKIRFVSRDIDGLPCCKFGEARPAFELSR